TVSSESSRANALPWVAKETSDRLFMMGFLELILGGIARDSRITARTAVKDRRPPERRRVVPALVLDCEHAVIRFPRVKVIPPSSYSLLFGSTTSANAAGHGGRVRTFPRDYCDAIYNGGPHDEGRDRLLKSQHSGTRTK